MHITPENIQESLKNRTDYYEHCYEYINEIPGASYEIKDDTAKTYLEPTSSVREDGWIKVNLQYEIKASVDFWRAIRNSTEMKYADVGFYLVAQNSDNTQERILLPTGTSIFLGSGEEKVSNPTTDRQSTVYYYQGRRKQTGSESDMICLNQLNENVSNTIEVSFDFANADLNELSAYKDKAIYLVADLVITEDKDLPAAGEVKDTWQSPLNMEAKDDIGFSLEVEDIKTLNMTNYRVKAYLVVEDANSETNQQGCMKKATVRTTAWTGVSTLEEEMKQKNDCFIFTVAKIKTNLN